MLKNCRQCQIGFEITGEDLAFYAKVSPVVDGTTLLIPAPTLCPQCRQQQRFAFRNERKLYNRKCDKTGQEMISMFPPQTRFPVYHSREWWKGDWDATSYGQEVDFSRPFFEQLRDLQTKVPRPHNGNYSDDRLQNSAYTNCAGDLKDCYLIFGSLGDERCYYSSYLNHSADCMDCFFTFDSELCYGCVDVTKGYNLNFCQSSKDCRDSAYLFDCNSCSDCISCVGLRHQQYCFLNKQLTKEEFQKVKQELEQGSRKYLEAASKQFQKILEKYPHRFLLGDKNENSTGNSLWNTKNCESCFDTTNAEDCKYCVWFVDGKDCQDIFAWGESELCYQIVSGGEQMYHCAFTVVSWGCKDSYYLDLCYYSKNCFGCVGLNKNEYCILNKQYTKEEYELLLPQVVEHMKKSRLRELTPPAPSHSGLTASGPGTALSKRESEGAFEWGEYFPYAYSPYPYSDSVAQEYYPLDTKAATELQAFWREENEGHRFEGARVQVPDKIDDVKDSVLAEILTCDQCDKNYKIIAKELEFYRERRLPVPTQCHNCRHANRVALRNPRQLWQRTCAKCKRDIESSFSPERPEIVYCEVCYQAAVY